MSVLAWTAVVAVLSPARAAAAAEPAPAAPANVEPAAAEGAPASVAPGELPAACQPGRWDLDGAGFRVGEDTDFNSAWTATLEDIAGCLGHPRLQRACAQVQGRVDLLAFTTAIVQAYGSQQAAQDARAQGRASRVLAELKRLGVPSNRLREAPPGRESSFRGARVELVLDCLVDAAPATTVATQRQIDAAVEAAVTRIVEDAAKRPEDDGLSRAEIEAAVAEAVAEAVSEHRAPPRQHQVWAEALVGGSLIAGSPSAALSTLVAVGGGWTNDLFYAHLDLGIDVGTPEEQRFGFEGQLAGGYVFQRLPWLEVGVVVGDRLSSVSPVEPWLEQSWFVGLESSQCLFHFWPGNDTCFEETLVPLGRRVRRGEANAGTIERIETQSAALFRFDLAVVGRHNFL
jgi:hypothetical protein